MDQCVTKFGSAIAGFRRKLGHFFASPLRIADVCLYAFMVSCILANIYVLFSGADTIFYLRVYHAVRAILRLQAG